MLLDAHTNLDDKYGRSVVCPVSSAGSDLESNLCPDLKPVLSQPLTLIMYSGL